jgi:hypothetical protein
VEYSTAHRTDLKEDAHTMRSMTPHRDVSSKKSTQAVIEVDSSFFYNFLGDTATTVPL